MRKRAGHLKRDEHWDLNAEEGHTDERDHVNLLTILTLEASSDPAASTDIGHTPDTSEHVPRSHDE